MIFFIIHNGKIFKFAISQYIGCQKKVGYRLSVLVYSSNYYTLVKISDLQPQNELGEPQQYRFRCIGIFFKILSTANIQWTNL